MTSDCMDDRTTTRISLKPCPFCGSPAELEEDSDHHGKWFNLGCSNHWGKRSDEKHCIGARIFYTAAPKEKSGAIEKWNTRAQGAATPAPTAALTEEEIDAVWDALRERVCSSKLEAKRCVMVSLAALLTQVRNETLEEAALKMEARRAAFKANAGSLRRSLALRALSMSDAFAHAAHDLRSLKSPG